MAGVGDASLGEWVERRPRVIHIRRRLSAEEQRVVGGARDIRGTNEEVERMKALLDDAPHLAGLIP